MKIMRRLSLQPSVTIALAQIGWARWLPLGCVLLLLAFTPLGAIGRDLWTDEAYTASYTAHLSIGALLEDVRKNEETPPLGFVLFWLWARIYGSSEPALRMFSLLCGALAALLLAHFAQRRLPQRAALIAGATLALTPLISAYMVEARGYTLTLLLAVLCVITFEDVYAQPGRRAAYLRYGLAAAALFLTSYFGAALLLAHNLIWLAWLIREPADRLRRLIGWSLTQLGMAAIVAPWLPALLYQMQVAESVTAAWGDGLRDYYVLALSVLAGLPPPNGWWPVWLALALLSWGLIFVVLYTARHDDQGLVLRTFAVPALVLAVLIGWMQVVAPRYLIIVLPGAVLAVAQGCLRIERRYARLGMLLAVALIGGLLVYRTFGARQVKPTRPWGDLATVVAEQVDPARDVVLFHPPWDQRIFEYYYQGPAVPLLGAHHYDDFYHYQPEYELRSAWTPAQALAVTRAYRRVWVFYDQMFHRVPPVNLPYRQVGHWMRGRLELFLYEVPDEID